jgi:uncharacterized protein (TIGR03083 family)
VDGHEVPQGDAIEVELDPARVLAAYSGHRRRFAAEVSSLDLAALAEPSRCERWSVADVLRHGCDVDSWLTGIWSGGPLPFDRFDPLVTPDECVAAGRDVPDEAIRDRYVQSAEQMAAEVGSSTRERWGTAALSPLGVVPWWQSVLHILWDSWVHERDALLPIGVSPPVEPEELGPVVVYTLALVGTFLPEPIEVEVAGARLDTSDGTPRVTQPGDGVRGDEQTAALVDALAGRGRWEDALSSAEPQVASRIGALARYFRS